MIHSYSSISCHDNCPWQFHDRYVLRNKHPVTPQQAAGTAAHLALQRRLEDRRALPPELASAEPLVKSLEARGRPIAERKLAMTRDFQPCDFWADDAWLRGVLDVLVPLDAVTIFNADWKTGKVREQETQLFICASLVLVNFAHVEKVIGANIWLRDGKPGQPYPFERRNLAAMLARLVAMTAPIEADTTFTPRPSGLCRWCPVADCKARKYEYAP